MQILKVIALLLDYPRDTVRQHRADLALAISHATEISPDMRSALLANLGAIYEGELLDAEVGYSNLFDQGRALPLHLFEHVHGESRDRGQAMVDLLQVYEDQGFAIDRRELPDYIPLFLEFLSCLPDMEAREWLADVSHILARLGARLSERGSSYAHLLEALLSLCGKSNLLEEERRAVAGEERDDTAEAIDREWEEAAVTFSPPEPCNTPTPSQPRQETLHWVDAASSTQQQLEGHAP